MNYIKRIYNDNLSLYGVYNSIAFGNGAGKINYNIIKSNVISNFLSEIIAGKGGSDIAAYIIINGRKIPILAILQEYMNEVRSEKLQPNSKNGLVYIDDTKTVPNTWQEGAPSKTLGLLRSSDAHKVIDSISMNVMLNRKIIYNLGQKYG